MNGLMSPQPEPRCHSTIWWQRENLHFYYWVPSLLFGQVLAECSSIFTSISLYRICDLSDECVRYWYNVKQLQNYMLELRINIHIRYTDIDIQFLWLKYAHVIAIWLGMQTHGSGPVRWAHDSKSLNVRAMPKKQSAGIHIAREQTPSPMSSVRP